MKSPEKKRRRWLFSSHEAHAASKSVAFLSCICELPVATSPALVLAPRHFRLCSHRIKASTIQVYALVNLADARKNQAPTNSITKLNQHVHNKNPQPFNTSAVALKESTSVGNQRSFHEHVSVNNTGKP